MTRYEYYDPQGLTTDAIKRQYHRDCLSLDERDRWRRSRIEKARKELKRRGLKLKIARRPPWGIYQ